MSVKAMIIGAQLESINEELERRETIAKKLDTASGGGKNGAQPIRISGKYMHMRDLYNQIEELRAQKKALEEQLTEISLLDETMTNVPESKYVKLGKKGL